MFTVGISLLVSLAAKCKEIIHFTSAVILVMTQISQIYTSDLHDSPVKTELLLCLHFA